jgi:Domain of unknown function (DUF1844)
MSTTPNPTPATGEANELLFDHLVHHLASMAALLLGAQPHPESGERVFDLDGARLFIDQLEMLSVKTRGNLDAEEARFLQQTLTGLRMLYVQAANHPPQPAATPTPPAAAQPETPAASSEESAKRYSKKY